MGTGPGVARPQRALETGRPVALSQLLFAAVYLVALFVLQLFLPRALAAPSTLAGIAVAFATTVAALAAPWQALRREFIMLLPFADIVAVALLRPADPSASIGLLWVFPTIWLAGYFGVVGAIVAVGPSTLFLVASSLGELRDGLGESSTTLPRVVMLPIALAFVGTSAALSSRRTRAQRALLRAQAGQLERALGRARRQEELLGEVLNTVDFGVVRLDRSGHGAVMNRAYATLYDLDLADLEAARRGAAFAADRRTPLAEHELPFNRAAAGDEFDDVVTWIPDRAGGLTAVSVTARRLYDADGEPDGSVVVARDVTAELSAVRARDDLVSSVSHELRTPMTSVLGYIELSLDEPGLSDALRGNLEVMERNGQRMLQLVADILDGAREADVAARLVLGDADLGALVAEAREAALPRAEALGVALEITSAEPTVVRGDAFRLRQVIDNLVANAVKYNRPGGSVAIGVTADRTTAWIVVRDTGIGIGERDLARVFDRFFRADAVRRGSVHGSGLGLGIARDLVERHGGRLDIDSEEGGGTTVIVRLPVAGPEDE